MDFQTIDKIDEDTFRIAQVLYYPKKDFYIIPIRDFAKDLPGKVCFLKSEIRLMLSRGIDNKTLDQLVAIKRVFEQAEICETVFDRPNFMV